MKYVVIGYTSNIDTKLNIAKIKYVADYFCWIDDIKNARYFNTREQADEFIEDCKLRHAISYGVENQDGKH